MFYISSIPILWLIELAFESGSHTGDICNGTDPFFKDFSKIYVLVSHCMLV